MEEKKGLSKFAINAYAAYGTCQSFGFWIPFLYLSVFMTTYLGFTAAQMGTVLLIAKSIDFCCSLVAGGIVSASNPRKGKYLPWMRVLRFVIAAGAILQMLNTSSLPFAVRGAVIACGYAMMHGSMNFMVTCQYGLMASMAGANMDDRFAMTSRQSQISAAGSILLSFGTLPLITRVGQLAGDPSKGYTYVSIAATLFLLLGVSFLSKAAAPYDVNRTPANYKRPRVRDMISAIFSNDQMRVYMIYQIVMQTGTYIVSGMAMYYWLLVMNRYNMYSLSAGISTCLGFVFALFIPRIGKKLGKQKAQITNIFIMLASKAIMYFLALRSIWWMTFATCFASAGMYLTTAFGVNYYLDIGEYGYYHSGKDFRTLSMSMSNIPMKVSMAIGGALSAYVLAWIGFDGVNASFIAGTLDMTSEAFQTFRHTFMAIYTIVPSVSTILSLLIFKFGYKITDADAKMYAAENARRDAEALAAGETA